MHSVVTAQDPRQREEPLPSTRRKREAEDWALVLVAEGFEPRVVRNESGWQVEVPQEAHERAIEILKAYRAERLERQRRLSLPPPRGPSNLEAASAYALALALLVFHLGLEAAGRADPLVEVGGSRAALVLDGEAWRLVTALTLHADLPHALGNTLFGGLFLAALAGRLGIGLAFLTFVASGTLGNLANAVYYGSNHGSIGASTGVFGLVGVLAGLAAWRRHQGAIPGRGAWVAFGAGLAIVAMLGSGGPEVDLSAHLFGLAAGGLTGLVLAIPFAGHPRPGRTGQIVAFGAAALLIAGAWTLALAAG
ncbi:MAG: rhomboid family intramembrane serine protease [Deltaproteobacteria bacterium]|jgi:membrane associated rhomboid family serine protease|nr:rhomboid family intramembrane serine protease [Deltaproteobacteria bacterium]MBW2497486.1 rhomboid family intramembrane serine protease [Deltaproteobacteria bacterium]